MIDIVFYRIYLVDYRPLIERRRILEEIMTPIKNHVQLSEYHLIRKTRELSVMIAKVSERLRITFTFYLRITGDYSASGSATRSRRSCAEER